MHYLIAIFLLLLIPAVGQAEKRLALVIGNNAYTNVAPLGKAVPDASAVSVTLN